MDLENQKLSSPFYPQNYLADGIGCEWVITAPEGNIILIEFEHFDVGDGGDHENFVSLFDGVCHQSKELKTLYGSMSNDVKWIISSSGRYMYIRFSVDDYSSYSPSSTGFLAKIHYGKEMLYLILL